MGKCSNKEIEFLISFENAMSFVTVRTDIYLQRLRVDRTTATCLESDRRSADVSRRIRKFSEREKFYVMLVAASGVSIDMFQL